MKSNTTKKIVHDRDQEYKIVEVPDENPEVAYIVTPIPKNMKEAECESLDDIVDLDDFEQVIDRTPGR